MPAKARSHSGWVKTRISFMWNNATWNAAKKRKEVTAGSRGRDTSTLMTLLRSGGKIGSVQASLKRARLGDITKPGASSVLWRSVPQIEHSLSDTAPNPCSRNATIHWDSPRILGPPSQIGARLG